MNRNRIILVALILMVMLGLVAGPRTDMSPTIEHIDLDLPGDAAELDSWLAASESTVDDLTPGTEKTVVWAGEPGVKTPLSLVYVHGWSATRQETRPFADRVAEQLGANLYYTRLTGHGRSGDAMAEVTLDQLAGDMAQAVDIGRLIGERVVLIGTSTGGSMAVWAATRPEFREHLAGLVLISPNFAPKDGRASIVLWPWGKQLLRLFQGPVMSWRAENERHEQFWTTSYPSDALIPMMAMVRAAREAHLESIDVPTLAVYSPDDGVIDADLIPDELARFSGELERLTVHGSDDPRNHVLAGDILSPSTTDRLVQETVAFLRRHLR